MNAPVTFAMPIPGSFPFTTRSDDITLCIQCRSSPKCVENGYAHDYCSKTCARIAGALASDIPPSELCIECQTRPKYRNTTEEHQYCGKTCAENAKIRRSISSSSIANEPRSLSRGHEVSPPPVLPGISEISPEDPRFKSIADQFYISWRHSNKVRPTVEKIYEVKSTPFAIQAYNSYRDALENRSHFATHPSRKMTEGNEQRRWHGTRRKCLLGDPGQTDLCDDPTCSLCSIIGHSYDMNHVGRAHGCKFGRGIYVSSTSSKSNDYIKNEGLASGSPLKAILLNKVLVGRGYKVKLMVHPTYTAPPKGYDSVLGEVGGILNHDETIVYRGDAIIPSYLVMYWYPY